MWLSKFVQLLFTAALLSTQVIAGDKKVPRPRELGLYIPKPKNGWLKVRETDGFFAKVHICPEWKFIEVASLENPTDYFKSYEAVMSVWEHQSKLTVGSLERIKYMQVLGPDADIINTALKRLGHNLSNMEGINGIKITRDSPDHTEIWNLLNTASFAKDAVEMCTEFQDMSNRYLQSLEIGRYDDDFDKWVEITFATKAE